MLKSLIIAFSTYSKIPMPRVDWDEKSMKYSMCFFPVVGAVIGGALYALMYFFDNQSYNPLLAAALLTILPVIITGGIHVDGFLDTVDAKGSYKPAEEKLKILKDPHVGAFAVIYCAVYFVLYLGLMSELVIDYFAGNTEGTILFAISFIYTRTLSGYSVVSFKKAKTDGMLSGTASASANAVRVVLLVYVGAVAAALMLVGSVRGMIVSAIGLLVFLYYYFMSKSKFGGITGDLAGYFLQLCEIFLLAGCVL